jgi:hypothetical protein
MQVKICNEEVKLKVVDSTNMKEFQNVLKGIKTGKSLVGSVLKVNCLNMEELPFVIN